MPTLFKMSDEKQATDAPTAVVIAATQEPKIKKTKKYVIIAVSTILGAAIILTAILVGMYMFTAAQKDIIKYAIEFNQNTKQDVVSDPNTNIVQYHVSSPGQDSWIVNDFNKDIQVVKIQTDKDTICYLNALNRSIATDPSKVAKPTAQIDTSDNSALTYMTSNTPVSDTSFLPKAARDMCNGISVYWVYPHCADKTAGAPPKGTDNPSKSKRAAPQCRTGCCYQVCSCYVTVNSYWSNGRLYCDFYFQGCPSYNQVDITYNTIYC